MSPHDAAPSVPDGACFNNARFYANEWPMIYRTKVLWQPYVVYVRIAAMFTAASWTLCTIISNPHCNETVTHLSDYVYKVLFTNIDQSFKS